jgi:hypothetical protein
MRWLQGLTTGLESLYQGLEGSLVHAHLIFLMYGTRDCLYLYLTAFWPQVPLRLTKVCIARSPHSGCIRYELN